MLTREEMGGVYALTPTTYKDDGRFNERAFRSNVKRLCAAGVNGVVTTGTVGEFNTIAWDDHKRLIIALVDETKKYKHIKAIPGCSGVNTRAAIKKTEFAQANGADAVMNIVPFYQVLNRNEVIEYYRELAEACPRIGIIVYNNPFTGRVLHDAETYARLAEVKNIVGSKETTRDFVHWMKIVASADLAFMHMDSLLVPSMMWGGRGCFSFTACIKPELVLAAFFACKEKNWEKAMQLQYVINDLLSPYNIPGHEIRPAGDPSVYKAMVEAAGFLECGPPGKPYLPLTEEVKARLTEAIGKKLKSVD